MRRLISLLLFLAAAAIHLFPGLAETDGGMELKLIPVTPVQFTNALFHYVYFDAEVHGAEKVTVELRSPEGQTVGFRTRKLVDQNRPPVNRTGYTLKKDQEKLEGLNVLFLSDCMPGMWSIEAKAYAEGKEAVTARLEVCVQEPKKLELKGLKRAHDLLTGVGATEVLPVTLGKVRYIAQDPKDPLFVNGYWVSPAYDLRKTANRKCSRAVFSMALSFLEVDCTPVRMSEMLRAEEVQDYTFDPVCRKLGDVERTEGNLETLWKNYQEGAGSPLLLHFRYDGGMHAVLLLARDEEDPELFYAVTSGQTVNTLKYPDGKARDPVIPILIEKGETGERIQSPMLERYHKAVIDEIWQWRIAGEH